MGLPQQPLEDVGGWRFESKMLQAVVFDYNGLLIDDLKLLEEAYWQAAHNLGFELSRERVRRFLNYPATHKKQLYFGDIAEQSWRAIFNLKEKYYYEQAGKQTLLFPEVEPVLTCLADRYVLALLSNTYRSLFERTFPAHLARLFRETRFADELAIPKPSPEPLRALIHALGVSPGECCYVGDAVTDVQMARAAGVTIFAVATGVHSGAELRAAGADWVAANLSEMAAQIESFRRSQP
ncbi:MAG: HAD family hydrolase [Desulfobacterales bacterium]|nr:MAG: HAD family hydrolase [Desulfobacterales bacterium]